MERLLVLLLLAATSFGHDVPRVGDSQVDWAWERLSSPVFPAMFGQECHVYTNATTGTDQMLVYSGYHLQDPKGASNLMYRVDFPTLRLFDVEQHAQPGATIPYKREGTNSILDPSRTVMLIFGGAQAPAEAFGDTWELNITTFTWTEYTAGLGQGPSKRYGCSLVWVPEMNCALLFAGSLWQLRIYHNDMWCYSFESHTWREIRPRTGDVPDARFGHTAAYFDGHMYIYGGGNSLGQFHEVWALDVKELVWGRVLSSSPPARGFMQSTIVDGHWVIIGGAQNSTDNIQVWRWPFSPTSELGQWELIHMEGTILPGVLDHCVANHEKAALVYLLGGFSYEEGGPINLFARYHY